MIMRLLLHVFDLILQQQTNRVGKLVKGMNAGKISSVNKLGRSNILVVPGKNTDDRNPVGSGVSYLEGRIANSALLLIGYERIVILPMDLYNIIWLCIGQNDQNLVIIMFFPNQIMRQAYPQAIPIAAV